MTAVEESAEVGAPEFRQAMGHFATGVTVVTSIGDDGVLAALECTVENRLPGGDHEIVVGRVRDVEISAGSAAPLLYWRGSYLPLGRS